MADEKTGKIGGWVKAGIASAASLISGATLMYISPLVNSAIKPSKPVANFAFQGDGLAITFANRSAGGSDGWWDFGDGTALEPFVAGQEAIQHNYAQAGIYNVKLNLRNYVGEENERAVSVPVDTPGTALPVIEDFQIIRVNADNAAPAVFRVIAKVKNTELAIWSLGDERPLEVNPDPTNTLDRLVTIKEMGYHNLRLVAVNGKQIVERSEIQWVAMEKQDAPGATLQVSYDAVQVRKRDKNHNVVVTFDAKSKEQVQKFAVDREADPGYQISRADFVGSVNKNQVRNLKVEIINATAPDKPSKVHITGELVKSSTPTWSAQIKLSQEMRTPPVRKTMDPIPVALQVPGITVLPVPALQANWEAKHKNMNLELRDGNTVVWRGSQLPTNQVVQFKNRPCRLTATEAGDQIRLKVDEIKSTLSPMGS